MRSIRRYALLVAAVDLEGPAGLDDEIGKRAGALLGEPAIDNERALLDRLANEGFGKHGVAEAHLHLLPDPRRRERADGDPAFRREDQGDDGLACRQVGAGNRALDGHFKGFGACHERRDGGGKRGQKKKLFMTAS